MAETYKKLAQELDALGDPIKEQEFEVARSRAEVKEVIQISQIDIQIATLQAELTRLETLKTSLSAL